MTTQNQLEPLNHTQSSLANITASFHMTNEVRKMANFGPAYNQKSKSTNHQKFGLTDYVMDLRMYAKFGENRSCRGFRQKHITYVVIL